MRAGLNAGPVWIGGRIPGPKRVARGSYGLLEFLITAPIWALVAVIYALAIALWLVSAVLWLIGCVFKVVLVWLPLAVTWPLRAPCKAWRRRRNRRLLVRADRLRRADAARQFTRPPTGQRVA